MIRAVQFFQNTPPSKNNAGDFFVRTHTPINCFLGVPPYVRGRAFATRFPHMRESSNTRSIPNA